MRCNAGLVALNSSQLLILGGTRKDKTMLGDALVWDTDRRKVVKTDSSTISFQVWTNQCTRLAKDRVVAYDTHQSVLLEYRPSTGRLSEVIRL